MTIEQFNDEYLVSREGTNSEKWETKKDKRFNTDGLLPMWVADMEFRAPDEADTI